MFRLNNSTCHIEEQLLEEVEHVVLQFLILVTLYRVLHISTPAAHQDIFFVVLVFVAFVEHLKQVKVCKVAMVTSHELPVESLKQNFCSIGVVAGLEPVDKYAQYVKEELA